MKEIDSILARLLALHPKRIDLTLERMWRILEALDHPQRQLPPVIHVAGTNGKGSTIAFMRAILEAAGRRVHVYTSPHLVRFNERFRLGAVGEGRLASDAELAEALAVCERANAGAPITVFEITTAAGLLLFARHPADVLLLEVGLGGRLDATNVIERPLATVMTPVALDHAEFLGDTVAKVAAEKAGILKPGVPCLLGRLPAEAHAEIARRAGEDWIATEERGRLVYQDDAGLLDLPPPKLNGRHQFENAGLAIATLRSIASLDLSPSSFEGIAKAEWPGRMQRLSAGKLAALVPPGGELWLDGGHNPDGGRIIANALADLEERVSRPLVLIVGMLANKDCVGFLKNFTGLARRIVAIPIPEQENAAPAARLAQAARSIGLPAEEAGDLVAALDTVARLDLDPPPRILITGSLYLAGAALAQNGTPPG